MPYTTIRKVAGEISGRSTTNKGGAMRRVFLVALVAAMLMAFAGTASATTNPFAQSANPTASAAYYGGYCGTPVTSKKAMIAFYESRAGRALARGAERWVRAHAKYYHIRRDQGFLSWLQMPNVKYFKAPAGYRLKANTYCPGTTPLPYHGHYGVGGLGMLWWCGDASGGGHNCVPITKGYCRNFVKGRMIRKTKHHKVTKKPCKCTTTTKPCGCDQKPPPPSGNCNGVNNCNVVITCSYDNYDTNVCGGSPPCSTGDCNPPPPPPPPPPCEKSGTCPAPDIVNITKMNDVFPDEPSPNFCATASVYGNHTATLTMAPDWGRFDSGGTPMYTVSGTQKVCATYIAPSEVPPGGQDTITVTLRDNVTSKSATPKTTTFVVKEPPANPGR